MAIEIASQNRTCITIAHRLSSIVVSLRVSPKVSWPRQLLTTIRKLKNSTKCRKKTGQHPTKIVDLKHLTKKFLFLDHNHNKNQKIYSLSECRSNLLHKWRQSQRVWNPHWSAQTKWPLCGDDPQTGSLVLHILKLVFLIEYFLFF